MRHKVVLSLEFVDVMLKYIPVVVSSFLKACRWNRDGAVVRALASHQWGPGSIPGLGVICGLSLLLVLAFAPRRFSPGTVLKNQHF